MSMEIDAGVPFTSIAPRTQNAATILCCQCGAPVDGTTAINSLCYDCVKLSVDVSEGIPREGVLHTCRDCDRWMSPPSSWLTAAPESRELLSICLRKLQGLHKVRLVDASFIWTEPHSRRVRVKITVAAEISAGTILQQTFEVEYVVRDHQCPDCQKSYTHHTWRASVQVRQKVPHKRTFLYLEQLILKYGAHKDTINIKEVHNGIDFYFAQRNQAEKFVDFIKGVAPVQYKKSQQLISMDIHTSSKSYKFSFSIEIVPLCKDDLIALPLKLAKQIGQISPIVICHKIGTSVYLLDPNTLQTADIPPNIYWRAPFASLANVRQLTEFIIMDIEPLGPQKGRFVLAEATVRRASDLGINDIEYTTRTHLGALLAPGDSAMGYHLVGTNFNSPEFEAIEGSDKLGATIPDVVLIKKAYPRRKKNKGRNWKLKRMAREQEQEETRERRQKGGDQEEMDYEMFLRDVEEDKELREQMELYKAQQMEQKKAKRETAGEGMDVDDDDDDDVEATDDAATAAIGEEDEEDDADDDGLQIPLDELKEEFEAMNMTERE